MASEAVPDVQPIGLGADEGEALWFLGALVTIKAEADTTAGRAVVTHNMAPRGHGSPLHVHRREDEWFYVLEGELTFEVDGEVLKAGPGGFVYGPRDIPHAFVVTSDVAQFLLVAEPADFSGFLRAIGEPATVREIPPPSTEPPDFEALGRVAASFGIEILGPPSISA